MKKNLINDASELLLKSISGKSEEAYFEDETYKTVEFNERNFNAIIVGKKDVKVGFVDGGNIEIVKSSNFSLQLIRLFWTIYHGKKRIDAERIEFYLLARAVNKDNMIYYETEIIAGQEWPKELNMRFYSYDTSIRQGFHRADISFMANIVRRFGEVLMAVRACENLAKNDIIVLDGDLEASYPKEDELLERLYNKSKDGIIIGGLSKTSTLLSNSGNSFSAMLNQRQGKWYYYPVVEIQSNMHKAEILFAKLHEKSSYIFKIEIYNKQKEHIPEAVAAFSENATDAIFLGYPYGLIDAHKFAKADANERDFHKIQLMAKLGKKWKDVERYLRAVDGHGVLDKV